MAGAYYNDTNPYCAAWLRELIAAGLIPAGDVDERSIKEVQPDDVRSYTQCHFFAGFGGWALAARLAGWPDDRLLWTGSCPCQPFSVAGKGGAFDDPRHLWPDFYRVIQAVRPPVVMGEQVAQKAGYGWFDRVAANLESQNYACRAVDIPSCAVNAPHRRNRIYWVAQSYDVIGGPKEYGRYHEHWEASGRLQSDSYLTKRGPWDEWTIIGPDDKGRYRRIKPGIACVAPRRPNTSAILSALGNGLTIPLAAEVIRAYMEVRP